MPKLNEARADGKVWRMCDGYLSPGNEGVAHCAPCEDWRWPYAKRHDYEAIETVRACLEKQG